jgi:hypothetical protein
LEATVCPLLLAAALTLAQVRTVETLPAPPTFTLDAQREVVRLTVQPPEGATVRAVAMDLPDSRSWAKPTKTESLAKNGVRATFRHPHASYAFVVTLADDSQYRVTVTPTGRLDVTQTRPAPPTIPG